MTLRNSLALSWAAFFLGVLFLATPEGNAQTVLVGVNTPGSIRDIQLNVGAGATNLSLSISGSASSYSHLILRAGAPPSATVFDFIAAADGQPNAIRIERPDLKTTNYTLRVRTPTNSLTHNYTITVTTNEVDLRTAAKPVTKSLVSTNLGSLAPNSWHYFRVDVPTNVSGWKLTLSSTNSIYPDLYVQRDQVPTTGTYLRRSQSVTNDVMVFSGNELTPGVYLIGVYQPAAAPGATAYSLRAEIVNFTTLSWDPGATHVGTQVSSSPNTNGGDYYFKISTVGSGVGAWRTALSVTAGEADLYLSKGTAPTLSAFQFKSDRVGSDGFVLPSTAYSPGEDWFFLVRATPGSSWTLMSGEPYVRDLGVIALDGSSGSGSVPIGPEGTRFFKTTAPANILAWRLWLNGITNNVMVRRLAVPLPPLTPLPGVNDLSQSGQLLVVPGYLVSSQLYFVGVAGAPGTPVNLDSRQQSVQDIPFQSTNAVIVTGFGYTTYRTTVPTNQLAWQVNVVASNGNPNVAIRRNLVPNESNNDAYSDVGGLVTDSITLVPPTLSDGTFYVTVYGTNAHTFTLQSGNPVITDINYVSTTLNTDTNRAGWRFFRASDINQQIGTLGWDLFLTNFAPGTRIAVRRNAVPGIWNFRNPNQGSSGFHDALSTADFLQRPGQQADVWYVGVYNPTNALRNFTLITRALTPEVMTFDTGSSSRSGVAAGKWQYFRVDVPTNAIGWDLRLTNVSSGSPQIYVRRELLPTLDGAALAGKLFSFPVLLTNWPSGNQWAAGKDWTERDFSPDGSINEAGRVLTLGLGRPLEAGATYYVGVINAASSSNAMNYTVSSRGIGNGLAIPVTEIPYNGGSASVAGAAPRELACFRVVVPGNVPSWKVKLTTTIGDAVLAVAKDRLPNISANTGGSVTNTQTAGKKMLSLDHEHFVQIPGLLSTNLFPGTNYLIVVSEGVVDATNRTRIGTGTSSFTLQSLGAMSEINLGLLAGSDLFYDGQLEGGEVAAFHFQNTPDTLGFEISLEDRVGNPVAVSSPTLRLGDPGSGVSVGPDPYGNEGGISSVASPGIISVADPDLMETIMVKARLSGGDYPDASYTLRVRKLVAQPLAFDTGIAVVSDHSDNWRFFQVVVPPDAVGWDIRITDVQNGSPQLTVARDVYPISQTFGTSPGFAPGVATNWLTFNRWAAGQDWTQRSSSPNGLITETGRILAMGMGRPLEPGTYYVGIKNNNAGTTTMSYTLRSRGIGAGYTIPIVDLPYSGGVVTNSALAPREAAYYRTVIPGGASSWRVKLTTSSGESMLLALSNTVPSVLTGRPGSAGKSVQKSGSEHYLLLPGSPQTALLGGTHYLAVVSEGVVGTNPPSRIGTGTSSFVIESRGELPVVDLGVAGTADLVQAGTLEGGETKAFQFTAPAGLSSLEVRLEGVTGTPAMVVRAGPRFPGPGLASVVSGNGSVGLDEYGNEGGYPVVLGQGNSNTNLVTLANPTNGTFTVMVKARPAGTVFTNATFTLRVRALNVTVVDFEGGFSTVTNQAPGSWKYFSVEVPDNVTGWDIRLANVTAGLPGIAVRRDFLPDALTTKPWSSPGTSLSWPSSNQWAATRDWTRRSFSSTSLVNQDGRILAMGTGQPLEPGSYYIGVINATPGTNMSYTIVSRGVGDGLSIPVTDLAFDGGSATVSDLAPREAAYFRVTFPTDVPFWKVKLSATAGESMFVVLKDHLPNVLSGASPANGVYGKFMQKAGDEHYLLLPSGTQTNLTAGVYYLAAASEGLNPLNASSIGTGSSSFTITSEGAPPVQNLGTVGTTDLVQADSLEAGESRHYQVSVPAGIPSFEVALENRVGNPVLVVRSDERLVNPGAGSTVTLPGSVGTDDYGLEGGATITPAVGNANSSLITVANPTVGTYTIAIKARATTPGVFPAANYTLRVRQIPIPELNFTSEQNTNGLSHFAAGQLLNNQSAFFKVVVPTNVNGAPVIGWELNASQSSGLASIRVRKDLLPTDAITGMPFTSASAIIAPPFLTNGTWYVEVRGSNTTSFTLASRALALQRPVWRMPAVGEPVTTPGLTAPDFGDTGIDTNGVPIPGPVDLGTDLQNGYYHYYAVDIPTNNVGLFRIQLIGISGNPDMYLRTNLVPTASHQANGIGGGAPLADRTVSGSATEYANWVPVNGKTETMLKPGRWYVAVRAVGNANARYRLRLSTGSVQDLAVDGGNLSNQSVSGGDWRYYRLVIPSDFPPVNWSVTFSQQSGDVVLYLRDTIPPGNGANLTDIRDWITDQKNAIPNVSYDLPATYTFNIPPVRPGAVYFLGFRAKNDATFSVSSAVSGGTMTGIETIDFYGGTVTNTIPPNAQARYRIIAPPDASRWKHTSTHSNVVHLYLANGTLATPTANAWSSGGANSALDQYLNTWPWLPNVSYFLLVTNFSSVAQPFHFAMNGRSVLTDDSDNDGMPDRWEYQYFGNLGQNAIGDPDGDGVSNLAEYQEGTEPTSNTSLRPRLTVSANNGTVVVAPASSNYTYGTTVSLTAVPNVGFGFADWTGSASGSDNPLFLVMDGNKSIVADFKVPGDDFVQRIPIVGYTITTSGSNVGATRELGEPSHAGTPGGSSVWWTWTAPFSSSVTISATGTGFSPALGVYVGDSVPNLAVITSDIGGGGTNSSQVSFLAEAGLEYQIAVDGVNGGAGPIGLGVTMNGLFAISDPAQLPAGVFEFVVLGPSGQTIRIEATTDLVNWVTLTNVINSGGSVQFSDPTAPGFNSRYYRAVAP